MGLLDIVIHYIPSSQSKAKQSHDSSSDMRKTAHSSSRAMKFASDVAQKALSLMIVLRPVTMVAILAKEVSKFLGAQHVTHFPHSSLQQMQVGSGCRTSVVDTVHGDVMVCIQYHHVRTEAINSRLTHSVVAW